MIVDDEIMDEIVLGTTRGGRKPKADVQIAIVRQLEKQDLPALIDGAPGEALPTIRNLRSAHHKLAQVLAQGASEAEATLITGYSSSYISRIKGDPLFCQLMKHYQNEREAVFVDVTERLKDLGIAAIEEIQDRIETAPETLKTRELMEIAELGLVKGRSGVGQGAGSPGASASGGPVTFQISFVGPRPKETIIDHG